MGQKVSVLRKKKRLPPLLKKRRRARKADPDRIHQKDGTVMVNVPPAFIIPQKQKILTKIFHFWYGLASMGLFLLVGMFFVNKLGNRDEYLWQDHIVLRWHKDSIRLAGTIIQRLDIFAQGNPKNRKNVQLFPFALKLYYTKCTEDDKFILSGLWYIQIIKNI